ncbi:hypothetical protein BH23ACT10_BH23ACT10_10910 [soil metagenome]
MSPLNQHLSRVYGAQDTDDLDRAYRDWAVDYDRDLAAAGYAYFQLVPAVIVRHVASDGRLFDAGVGTGRLGTFLRLLGYDDLTGVDHSADMIAIARTTGAYHTLRQMDLGQPLDLPDDHFSATYTAGTFTTGHAPPHGFTELARVTRPGGRLIVALTEVARERDGFGAVLEQLTATRALELVEQTPAFPVFPYDPDESDIQARIDVYEVV